jgi:hypothetical protein
MNSRFTILLHLHGGWNTADLHGSAIVESLCAAAGRRAPLVA